MDRPEGMPRLSPDPDELAREVVRAADRVRVTAPRLAARATPEAAEVLTEVRSVVQRLADLTAGAGGRPPRAVPVLAPHGLADQVLVLGREAIEATRDGDAALRREIGALLTALRRRL